MDQVISSRSLNSPASPPPLRLLAVTRKPDSPSFQHRVLDYIEPLRPYGIDVTWEALPADSAGRRRLRGRMADFDGVWWHKFMLSPLGAGRWRKAARRIVYDFDDPVMYSTHPGAFLPHLTRRVKFACFLRRCDAALAASEYLAQHARRYCRQVFLHPMAVEMPPAIPDRAARSEPIRLLWMGSRPTLRFLRQVLPAIERLGPRKDVVLRVLAHEPVTSNVLHVEYRPWSPQEQEAALRESDIGLCPMPDTPWTRGKCPFKTLQYMAWGLPWVGSAVGENVQAAGPEGAAQQRGVCVADDRQWPTALERLIGDADLRRRMGVQGRLHVERNHDLGVLSRRLAEILREIIT